MNTLNKKQQKMLTRLPARVTLQPATNTRLRLSIKPLAITMALLFAPWLTTASFAAPLTLMQAPQSNAGRQPAPNVIISVDDSGSMGWYVDRNQSAPEPEQRMTYLKEALKVAFSDANIPDGRIRLAWQAMWKPGYQNISPGDTNSMRLFTGAHRDNFNNFVNNLKPDSCTPSHKMMVQAGEYMKTTGTDSPFATEPGVANSPVLACRRSYHIFMTDGEWNGVNCGNGDGYTVDGGNADGGGITQLPANPGPNDVVTPYDISNANDQTKIYRDAYGKSYQSTLADVAFHYWATDLQPSIPNSIAPKINHTGAEAIDNVSLQEYWNPKNDPATWQHLSQYTIGFGRGATGWGGVPKWCGKKESDQGQCTLDDNYNNLANGYYGLVAHGTKWGNVLNGDRTQDLWHSALNGRGKFYPARTPDALTAAFKNIIEDATNDTSKPLVSIAASTSYLSSNANAFLAGYDASSWSGTLIARALDVNGVVGAEVWNAGTILDAKDDAGINDRVVLSSNGSHGIAFKWDDNLTAAQQAAMNASDNLGKKRVNYLRGIRDDEVSKGGALRNRSSRLGDIVNSNLWAVGIPSGPFYSESFATFRIGKKGRTPMIYVGANDGMLHGFNATPELGVTVADPATAISGKEMLAYVPRGFMQAPAAAPAPLVSLTDPNYTHRYFVDGQPFSGDVEVGTNSWKTVLVSGLGAGGKGYVVLDVTNPDGFASASASSLVLADTTADTNANIGHIFAGPVTDAFYTGHSVQVTKMNDGRPAVIMGNGYNSVNEDAALVIQYLDTGEVKIIPTTKFAGSNGLSAPQVIDINGDGKADIAYAGDLKGNLWKFDLTNAAPTAWKVAFNDNPLFTAKYGNTPQAITTAPTWLAHPQGGIMLAFGTGRVLEAGDITNTAKQTLYGIYDNSKFSLNADNSINLVEGTAVNSDKSELKQQVLDIVTTGGYGKTTMDKVTYKGTNKRGWYADLPDVGERVTTNPNILDGLHFYIYSQVPKVGTNTTEETCAAIPTAGKTNINILNMLHGTAPAIPIFTGTTEPYGRKGINGNAMILRMTGNRAKLVTTGDGGGSTPCADPNGCSDITLFTDEGANTGWKQVQ